MSAQRARTRTRARPSMRRGRGRRAPAAAARSTRPLPSPAACRHRARHSPRPPRGSCRLRGSSAMILSPGRQRGGPMEFEPSERCSQFTERLTACMDEHVYPAEPVYERQLRESGDPHHQPPVMEELKARAREADLWNMFLPDSDHGAGLSNSDYAPLAEILGRSHIASEACNCSAPDTGNMEVLHQFATPEQRDRWLLPLLDGEIRSAFAMTEPDVASSDATNIAMRIEREGDGYVLNGRKWWTSNALHPNCRIMIVMGKTNPDAPVHKQQSQILVPIDAAGVTIVRGLPVFGYQDQEGHAEVTFEDVRVPATNLIAGEGDGFMIAQARLGPGRIHHCMRAIGAAERALEAMCARAVARQTFGAPVATRGNKIGRAHV